MRVMRGVVAGALAMGLAATAGAQPAGLTFNGTADLCFGVGCTVGNAAERVIGGLTYTPGAFTTTTDASGLAPIGGIGNNLGSLTLLNPPDFDYSGIPFTLLVDIIAPPTTPGSLSYTGTLAGIVDVSNNGVTLFFNAPLTRSFGIDFQTGPWAGYTGTASLTVPSFVAVNAQNPNQEIPAFIRATASTVPEPSTWALMGSGLLGLVGFARRRRQA